MRDSNENVRTPYVEPIVQENVKFGEVVDASRDVRLSELRIYNTI